MARINLKPPDMLIMFGDSYYSMGAEFPFSRQLCVRFWADSSTSSLFFLTVGNFLIFSPEI
jgi:hypothetical protein